MCILGIFVGFLLTKAKNKRTSGGLKKFYKPFYYDERGEIDMNVFGTSIFK